MDFASNLCSVCAPFRDVRRHRVKKAFVLYRQNVMLETQCCLFAIHSRFPKLNVAGSIPVSCSKISKIIPDVMQQPEVASSSS